MHASIMGCGSLDVNNNLLRINVVAAGSMCGSANDTTTLAIYATICITKPIIKKLSYNEGFLFSHTNLAEFLRDRRVVAYIVGFLISGVAYNESLLYLVLFWRWQPADIFDRWARPQISLLHSEVLDSSPYRVDVGFLFIA